MKRNPATDTVKQVLIAGATAAVTTAVAIIVTNWLTKKATIESVAKGETPLPKGATPTTVESKPVVAIPASEPQALPMNEASALAPLIPRWDPGDVNLPPEPHRATRLQPPKQWGIPGD